jgi:hypothetical protein
LFLGNACTQFSQPSAWHFASEFGEFLFGSRAGFAVNPIDEESLVWKTRLKLRHGEFLACQGKRNYSSTMKIVIVGAGPIGLE